MRAFCLVLALSPSLLHAQDYDGLYHPQGQRGWLCDAPSIGQDGGALAIREGKLFGIENTCEMTNPVSVRDMDATLYDLECSSEGETYIERMLVARSDSGVIILRGGFVAEWSTCR